MPNLLQKYVVIVGSIVLLTFSGNAQSKSSSSNSRAARIKKAQRRNDALVKAQNNGYKYLADTNKTYSDDKPGLMIVTTNDLKKKVKNFPKYVFTKHHVRKFRVFMSTEDDWYNIY